MKLMQWLPLLLVIYSLNASSQQLDKQVIRLHNHLDELIRDKDEYHENRKGEYFMVF
jgi:hypothetical protein